MFDKGRFQEVLAQYKQNFVSMQWGNEKYKWEAVKCFQDNWDVNATGFADMLQKSLSGGNDARNGENPHEYRLFCPSILLLILD